MWLQGTKRKGQNGTTAWRWSPSQSNSRFYFLSRFSQPLLPPFVLVVCLSISRRVFCSRSRSRSRSRSPDGNFAPNWGQVRRTEPNTLEARQKRRRKGWRRGGVDTTIDGLSIDRKGWQNNKEKKKKNGTCFRTTRTVGALGEAMGKPQCVAIQMNLIVKLRFIVLRSIINV